MKPKFLVLLVLVLSIFTVVVGVGMAKDSSLSAGQARKIIAKLAGINLPSDAVRVKSVSVTGNSAVVVAQVETAFRMEKAEDKWRVAEIRTGDRKWEDVDTLIKALNSEKTARARAELETVATALEAFHKERGHYIDSKSETVVVDNLNPGYLHKVVRVDPWSQEYLYEGTASTYTLRSAGPDGQPNTADDIVVSK